MPGEGFLFFMTDAELIKGCIDRDKKTWDEFVIRFSPIIHGSIRNTSKNHFEKYGKRASSFEYDEIVDELSHEVFVSILKDNCIALKKFAGHCPLGGYIGTIANRKAIDYWRRLRNQESIDAEVDTQEGKMQKSFIGLQDDSTREGLKDIFNRDTVALLLNGLDEQERKLCELTFLDELPPNEVAERLGINVDHFYVRKQRLIKKLKEIAAGKDIC